MVMRNLSDIRARLKILVIADNKRTAFPSFERLSAEKCKILPVLICKSSKPFLDLTGSSIPFYLLGQSLSILLSDLISPPESLNSENS